jgi:hypothetical protein
MDFVGNGVENCKYKRQNVASGWKVPNLPAGRFGTFGVGGTECKIVEDGVFD